MEARLGAADRRQQMLTCSARASACHCCKLEHRVGGHTATCSANKAPPGGRMCAIGFSGRRARQGPCAGWRPWQRPGCQVPLGEHFVQLLQLLVRHAPGPANMHSSAVATVVLSWLIARVLLVGREMVCQCHGHAEVCCCTTQPSGNTVLHRACSCARSCGPARVTPPC